MLASQEEKGTLGRETRDEMVLKPRLRRKLLEFNPDIPKEQIEAAVKELARDRSSMHEVRANKEIYELMRDGVKLEYRNKEGSIIRKTVQVIDWQQPEENDHLLVSQLWVSGEYGNKRPDLVAFINGLPVILFELKKTGRSVQDAFKYNLSDYKDTIPQLFRYNQVIILSNGADTKVGTLTSPWAFYGEWKKISDEEEPGLVSLETAIRGICQKQRLSDLMEHFILYDNVKADPKKLLARNHQYLGVNNAIDAVRSIEENKGKLGVFWHTQGSGKSYSMVFLTRKIMRALAGDWKFVIITDRLDLDDQIYKNFASVGAVTEPEQEVRADSKEQLQQLLSENHRYVFTLIHKFHSRDNEEFPVLSTDDDIIVITDAPSLSTLYLDKPMKNHTLMQTIARANRVFEGKNNGLIVDYVGVFRNLQKALAVYATGHEEDDPEATNPVKDKSELVSQLREAIAEAREFCEQQGVDLEKIIQSEGFEASKYQKEFARAIVDYEELGDSVDDAVEEVIINDQKKKKFITLANVVDQLYKAILPDPAAGEFLPVRSALKAIKDRIKIIGPQPDDDISNIKQKINTKLDESIVSEPYHIDGDGEIIDIGQVDFEKLKERFAQKKHKRVELQKMKSVIEQQVQQMVEQNRTRMDFKERFEEMIDKYNNYSIAVDMQLEELFNFVKDLDKEEERHAREHLTEEQLAVFDIITQHEKIELTKKERDRIKDGITELLEKLKQAKTVTDWKKQQRLIADVKVTIETELDNILPDQYNRQLFAQTCNEVFDHVYQRY